MGKVLALMLETHPVGVGLVARMCPETRVDLPLTPDARRRDFEGFAKVNVVRKVFVRMREKAKEQGDPQFIAPDTSMAALVAYLSYMRHDDLVWTAPEPEVRAAARLVTDGIMAALFVGLMQEIEARPDATTAWGDTGRALSDASQRARTVLVRAMAKLPTQLQTFLLAYRACAWEVERLAKRQRIPGRTVNARRDEAIPRLGEALRAELGAAPNALDAARRACGVRCSVLLSSVLEDDLLQMVGVGPDTHLAADELRQQRGPRPTGWTRRGSRSPGQGVRGSGSGQRASLGTLSRKADRVTAGRDASSSPAPAP
jgi:hypothetical protein